MHLSFNNIKNIYYLINFDIYNFIYDMPLLKFITHDEVSL